jgi:hypothetical protein
MTEQPGQPEPSAESPKSDDSAPGADAADDVGIEYEQQVLTQEEPDLRVLGAL